LQSSAQRAFHTGFNPQNQNLARTLTTSERSQARTTGREWFFLFSFFGFRKAFFSLRGRPRFQRSSRELHLRLSHPLVTYYQPVALLFLRFPKRTFFRQRRSLRKAVGFFSFFFPSWCGMPLGLTPCFRFTAKVFFDFLSIFLLLATSPAG